ncbi:putative oxidoreductase [Corynebacterium occultum]|uniref:Putative oxidoreductase n=1 Tax=Corynebacterium occultum TaxID=2675219 RepID=A0A6B8W828_9CORY|nr:SDR family oxidoreductase [Corynebacterium occultum]QGU08097.1 putative oxidoreductase [Corynebacterium occultum]
MSEKIAVITGATGGMGREMVSELAKDHKVYALGRNSGILAELAQLDNVTAIGGDLVAGLLHGADQQAYRELKELKQVDVLVHSAAIAHRHTVASAQPLDWRSQFEVNVFAAAELTRELLPALQQAAGLVVFINSGAGKGAHPGNIVYAATKHALYALADGLRKEQANTGVRVSTIAPGPTDTPMLQGLRTQAGADYEPEHYIEPEEVAKALRLVVDAGPSTQITDLAVRPRIELADRN